MKKIAMAVTILLVASLIGCAGTETRPQVQPAEVPEITEPVVTQEQTGLDEDLQDLEEGDAEDLDISEEDFSI